MGTTLYVLFLRRDGQPVEYLGHWRTLNGAVRRASIPTYETEGWGKINADTWRARCKPSKYARQVGRTYIIKRIELDRLALLFGPQEWGE